MSGQLRRPAEAHELLTQRESGTTSYQSNASWLARLGGLSERRLRQVDDALKEFSRDYDRLIDHFNNEIIQIRSADKASGLFVVASSALDIHRLHSELTPDSPFEKCFDRTLDIFWREVGVSLNAVGHYIDQRLKASMTALFLALEARLERIGERAVLSGLFRTVHTAQTDSLQAVERVRDWFTLPKSTSEPEFSLQQAFDAALELVRSFHEHFDPIVEIKCADIALIGALSEFTDIFILLLGNVWQHSHLDRPRITGEVILKPHGLFQAEIINEVASGYEDLTRPMLEESKALMRDGQYKARVSKEGRSGFAKILRLLNRLGAHDDWIEYGYLDARHFSVIFGGTIPIVMP
jgi:hypothetical protein